MIVRELTLQEFTAFEKADFTFSPGVNVLLGPNATGKSHVMKAIYSVLKAWDAANLDGTRKRPDQSEVPLKMLEKLRNVFKPEGHDAGRLVRMPRKEKTATISLISDLGKFCIELGGDAQPISVPKRIEPARCIFLPTREALSMYEGFGRSRSQSDFGRIRRTL
jgi:predicted ATP-dependent endonuclease of OLD family